MNKIPEGVTDRQALLVGDVLATGYWAARISEITEEDTVLIIGAGPTGICTLLSVMLKNPAKIIICEKDETRIRFINEHYPEILTVSPEDCKEFVKTNSEHGGADAVLEVAGAESTFKKKKGSDEFYTDMWYYLCKNRKMVSGHLCDYKKHIRQDEINTEVIQLVKYVFCGENDMKDQILKKLGSDDSLSELLQEKERLTKEHEKLDSKKSKQLRRINELDIDDELYDDLMKTYRAGVQEINEQIAIIENQMYQNDLSIDTMFFDDEDTENSLSNEKHVETVVLMSKVQK